MTIGIGSYAENEFPPTIGHDRIERIVRELGGQVNFSLSVLTADDPTEKLPHISVQIIDGTEVFLVAVAAIITLTQQTSKDILSDRCERGVDFSWSGNPVDLRIPDTLTYADFEDAAALVGDYETYILDPHVPLGCGGDGDSAVMLAFRIFSLLSARSTLLSDA